MFDRVESEPRARYFAMARKKSATAKVAPRSVHKSDQERANRLVGLRRAFQYETATAFAVFLGVSKQRWGHVETGRPLGIDLAQLVVRKLPGVSLDYLYYGKVEGLSVELARRLGALDSGGK